MFFCKVNCKGFKTFAVVCSDRSLLIVSEFCVEQKTNQLRWWNRSFQHTWKLPRKQPISQKKWESVVFFHGYLKGESPLCWSKPTNYKMSWLTEILYLIFSAQKKDLRKQQIFQKTSRFCSFFTVHSRESVIQYFELTVLNSFQHRRKLQENNKYFRKLPYFVFFYSSLKGIRYLIFWIAVWILFIDFVLIQTKQFSEELV